MKTDNLRESKHIEDRRGQGTSPSYNTSRSSFGGSSSAGNLIFSLLLSRLGWKGRILLLIGMLLFGGMSGIGGLLTGSTTPNNYQSVQINSNGADVSDSDGEFMSKVLASTEDFWTQEFAKNGLHYEAPTMVFYNDQTSTACGLGSAQAGPFYCSADKKIYIDTSFYKELSTRYKASGDFAMAYVIAHEVGHHVQNELGTMQEYAMARRGKSEKEANALNVRLELQADYYAGAWAKYVDGQGLLDSGDIKEAMDAAHAVGDDTLQEEAYGHSVPDSFTHGSSEQRQEWFDRGYKYGDIQHGDTFKTNI